MKRFCLLASFCLSFILVNAQVNLSSGLMAYYPFTGNANDVSGNNNNPVFNDATLTSDRFGNPNSAYHFNGTNTSGNHMQVPNSPTLNMGSTMSICAWVRPTGFYTGVCGNNMLVCKEHADYLAGDYSLRYSDYITGCTSTNIATEQFEGPGIGPFVQTNQWYSAVYTADGTTAKVYINCILVASFAQSGLTFTNTDDLTMGYLNNSTFPYWLNGDLDEVRIYNRAINQDEVNAYGGCVSTCLSTSGIIDTTICLGQSYNGHTVTGTYVDTLINVKGCDSIRTVNLTVNNSCTVPSCEGTIIVGGLNEVTLPAPYPQYYSPNGFTWECWFNGSEFNNTDNSMYTGQSLITSEDSVLCEDIDLGFGWVTFPRNTIGFNVDGAGSCANRDNNPCYYSPPGGFQTNTWYHVAGVRDYTNNITSLYFNGVLVDTKSNTGLPLTRSIKTRLGTNATIGGDSSFTGKMDEIRIWNYPRTAAEINANYNQCLTGNEPGLVTYYHANEATGLIVHDVSPNHNDGVLDSGVRWDKTDNAPLLNSCGSPSTSTIDTTICNGQNYFGYTSSGTYIDTYTNERGCDSVRTVNLTINNSCTSSCSPIDTLIINTGYNATTKVNTPAGQKDPNWIVTAMSSDMQTALSFANETTGIASAPTGTSVRPVSIGQNAMVVPIYPGLLTGYNYLSCFPYNLIYTVQPSVDNYTNCTTSISRPFTVTGSTNQSVKFNFNISCDDAISSVIIDAGMPGAITLFNTVTTSITTPVVINSIQMLPPGTHTLDIQCNNLEVATSGNYYNVNGTEREWNPFAVGIIGNITSTSNVLLNTIVATIDTTLCLGQSYLGHTASGTFVDTLTSSSGCDSIQTSHLVVNNCGPTPTCEGDVVLHGLDKIVLPTPDMQYYSSNGFTWECWFNGSDYENYNTTIQSQQLLMCSSDITSCEDIGIGFGWFVGAPANSICFAVDGPGLCANRDNTPCYYVPPGGFLPNTWYHVAGVKNYTTNQTQLYLNGNLVDTKTNTKAPFARDIFTFIGSEPTGPDSGFVGKMDEIRIWNYPRTAAQISANYNHCLAGSEPGLVSYYHANESTGLIMHDVSPNHNNATLEPTVVWDKTGNSPIVNSCTSPSTSTVDTTICTGQNYDGYDSSGTYFDTYTNVTGCDSVRTLYLTVNNNCTSSTCPLINNIIINTGYDPVTKTQLAPGQKDTHWIVTGMSSQMQNALCYNTNTTSAQAPPSSATFSPVPLDQYTDVIPGSIGTISCFPANTMYTVEPPTTPSSGNFSYTMDIKRSFFINSSSAENVTFNFTTTCDDAVDSIIIDAGLPSQIVLINTMTKTVGTGSPLNTNYTTSLSPGLHTLSIQCANWEDPTNPDYYPITVNGITSQYQWNPFGVVVTGTISSVNNVLVNDSCCTPTFSIIDSTICQGLNCFGHTTAGTYIDTLTNTGGCDSIRTLNLTINPSPVITTTPDTTICKSTSAQLIVNGGVLYQWTADPTLSSTNIYNPIATPTTSPVKYYVTVTDTNGCSSNDSIKVSTQNLVVQTINDTAVCIGSAVQLNTTGGVTYTWLPTAFLSNPAIANPIATPLNTTSYTVTGTSTIGCQGTATVDITVLSLPIVKTNNDTAVCALSSVQLNTSGAVTYSWTPSAGLSDPAIANPVAVTNNSIKYFVTGTDANGCKAKDSLIITINPLPVITRTPDTTICKSTSAQLIVSGGATYQWTADPTLSSTNIYNPIATPTTSPVKYYVTVTDTNGCSSNDSIKVSTQNLVVQTINDTAVCIGSAVQLNTTGGVTYTWLPTIFLSNPAIANPIATPLNTTSYTVTGTSAIGCQGTATVDITVLSLPIVKTNNDTAICSGQSVQLNTTGATTYLWSPSAGLSNTSIADPVSTPTGNIKYIVTGTISGCFANDTVNITVNPLPLVNTTNDTIICKNASVVIFANGGNSYQWSPASTLNNTTIANPVASPVTNTIYHVLVTDTNNCTNTDSVKVSIRPPAIFTVTPDTAICANVPTQLHAGGGDIYSWQPAAAFNNANISDPITSITTNTTYSVYIKENTCNTSASLSTTLTRLPDLTITAGKSNDLDCYVSSATLSASGADDYLWSPATGLNDTSIADPVAKPFSTQKYIVKGTNADGCSGFDSVTVYGNFTDRLVYNMANAFTPNKDGRNDCYGIEYFGPISEFKLIIYNRWGQEMFSTTNPSACWDGTFQGQDVNEGAYVYYIRAVTACGTTEKKGTVVLLR